MRKPEIIDLLKTNHEKFIDSFTNLNEQQFITSMNNKWSPGQQLDHIIKSVKPVVLALGLPHFIPRMLFGKATRPSRSYESLVEKYQAKLATGGKSPGQFVPGKMNFDSKTKSIQKLNELVAKLGRQIESKTDKQLDYYLLPHPLIGKLTFREMVMFTAYHAEHHEKAIIKNLAP